MQIHTLLCTVLLPPFPSPLPNAGGIEEASKHLTPKQERELELKGCVCVVGGGGGEDYHNACLKLTKDISKRHMKRWGWRWGREVITTY